MNPDTWEAAEIALRELLFPDDALSALQMLQARGWQSPDDLDIERDEMANLREQVRRLEAFSDPTVIGVENLFPRAGSGSAVIDRPEEKR